MKKTRTIAGAGVLVLAVAATALFVWDRGEEPPGTTPVGGAGMTATIDPETGEFVHGEVAPGDIPTTASDEEPVVHDSPAPGGGKYIDVQGRFQHTATATVDSTDSLHVDCEADGHDHGGR